MHRIDEFCILYFFLIKKISSIRNRSSGSVHDDLVAISFLIFFSLIFIMTSFLLYFFHLPNIDWVIVLVNVVLCVVCVCENVQFHSSFFLITMMMIINHLCSHCVHPFQLTMVMGRKFLFSLFIKLALCVSCKTCKYFE